MYYVREFWLKMCVILNRGSQVGNLDFSSSFRWPKDCQGQCYLQATQCPHCCFSRCLQGILFFWDCSDHWLVDLLFTCVITKPIKIRLTSMSTLSLDTKVSLLVLKSLMMFWMARLLVTTLLSVTLLPSMLLPFTPPTPCPFSLPPTTIV